MTEPDRRRPERQQTDESLQAERRKADHLVSTQVVVQADADAVVESARAAADAILDVARAHVDEAASAAAAQAAVAVSRALEDAALERERAVADAALRAERAETARALATLLPLERERTDRFLLTERARSDDAVARRDDFLGMVSHDLRNLLSGIVLATAAVSERATASGAEETRADARRIEKYAARMNRLIGDLVDVASIDAGRLAITPVRGDLRPILAEAVDAFAAAATAAGVAVVLVPSERPLPADVDAGRMLQVFANLITNAIKFTGNGGRLTITVEDDPAGYLLAFTDTGPGIPEAMLEFVFERFWQVGTNDRRGSGLGLYISRYIVEAHGGAIRAESGPGGGCRFSVLLPERPSPGDREELPKAGLEPA